jgi:hypothetical protein
LNGSLSALTADENPAISIVSISNFAIFFFVSFLAMRQGVTLGAPMFNLMKKLLLCITENRASLR